jgi:hypothetical protein
VNLSKLKNRLGRSVQTSEVQRGGQSWRREMAEEVGVSWERPHGRRWHACRRVEVPGGAPWCSYVEGGRRRGTCVRARDRARSWRAHIKEKWRSATTSGIDVGEGEKKRDSSERTRE